MTNQHRIPHHLHRYTAGWGNYLPLFSLIAVTGILPAGTAVINSFFHDTLAEREFVGFYNYAYIIGNRGFLLSIGITVGWVCAVTVITVTWALLISGLMHRYRSMQKVLYAAILIPWAVPIYILVPLWRIMLHGVGGYSIISALFGVRIDLLNQPVSSFLTAVLVSSWIGLPPVVCIIFGELSRLPRHVTDSAAVEGASSGQIYLFLQLPMIRTQLLAVGIVTFFRALSEFTVIFLLTAGGPPLVAGITEHRIIGATTTLELYLFDLFRGTVDTGPPAAAAVLMMGMVGICLIIWFRMQRSRPPNMKRKRLRSRTKQALWPDRLKTVLLSVLQPVALLGCIMTAVMMVYLVVWVSVSPLDSIFVNHLIPRQPTLRHFTESILSEHVFRYFGNTLLVAIPTALLVPLLCLPAAYALASSKHHGKRRQNRVVLGFVQIVAFSGGIHALIPLYILLRTFHLIDTYVPLIMVAVAHTVPFALFTFRAYLLGIPRCLQEQARLSGMSHRSYIVRILLPLCRPVVLSGMLVGFLNAWNSFLVALLFLHDDSRYTISVKIYEFVGTIAAADPRWGLFAASSILNMLIIGILFISIRRRLSLTDLTYVDFT